MTKIVQLILNELSDELVRGGSIELRHFGIFDVVIRKGRPGRNLNQPTQQVMIPERKVVKFRVGKELKARIEKLKPAQFKK